MATLSATAAYEYLVELGNGLPPPLLANEEHRKRRYTTAVEAFEALNPGDAYEGRLAVHIVLCGAHAVEIMREAGEHRDDFAKLKCCRSQAASMMREGRAAKRILAQEQKVRLATEAVAKAAPAQPVAAARPPSVVTPAAPHTPVKAVSAPPLVRAAPPQPVPAAAETRPVPPSPAMPGSTVIQLVPPSAKAGSAPPPSAQAIETAETFAADNLEVAVRIRNDRGVTPQCRAQFRGLRLPADPAVIDALVRGTSPLLSLLADFGDEELDAAD
jgi:hypothetical protein